MSDHLKCEMCGKFIKIIEQGDGELSCCGKPMVLLSSFKSSDEILKLKGKAISNIHYLGDSIWENKL